MARCCVARPGKNRFPTPWFGERQRAHDAFFTAELTVWQESGPLAHVDLASRDQPNRRHVPDVLRQHSADLCHWIDAEALVCVGGRHARHGGLGVVEVERVLLELLVPAWMP